MNSLLSGLMGGASDSFDGSGDLYTDWGGESFKADTTGATGNDYATLKNMASKFQTVYDGLLNYGDFIAKHPEEAEAYNDLMSKGTRIKQIVVNTINDLEMMKNSFTLSGIHKMQKLGFLPAIPIGTAIVFASVAALIAWLSNYINTAISVSQKWDRIRELEAKGIPTAQAVGMVNQTNTGASLFGTLFQSPVTMYVIGGLAILFIFSGKRS